MKNFIKKITEEMSHQFPGGRSVIFYRHSYYHFFYLAQALRKRGWNAMVVNLESQKGSNTNYYHGEDLNLFSEDLSVMKKNTLDFFEEAKKYFELVHFAGDGYLSFQQVADVVTPEIIEWKKLNKKIAHSISGCNSGTSKTAVSKWSALDAEKTVCDTCVWQLNSEICSDKKNLLWGEKLEKYCDLIFSETLPELDYMAMRKKVYRNPMTMVLDAEFWSPTLKIPQEFYMPKQANELLVYHAVGNYDSRDKQGRNIKGTPAVMAAVDRLKAEGVPVRLIFVTNMKNTEVRFIQAQVDVIVDQLNYGRYGATAREGMMLGKPVICYINQKELDPTRELNCLKEAPLVSATEETVYEVLKDLLLNPEKRKKIGEASRAYALKWHDADRCAERYEAIYDALMEERLPEFIVQDKS